MVVTTAWARPQNGLAEKQGQQNKRKDGGHGATEIKRTTAGSPCAWRCRLRRNVKRVLGEGSQAGPTDPAVRFLEIPGGASRSMAARSCLVVAAWGPPGGIGWGLHGLGLAAHWLPVGCSLAVRWQLTGQWPPHRGPPHCRSRWPASAASGSSANSKWSHPLVTGSLRFGQMEPMAGRLFPPCASSRRRRLQSRQIADPSQCWPSE